jgi:hypothetical protein
MCSPVEAATGVSRHDLRPDLYPRGLQDDVPFRPAAIVGGEAETVADETRDFLQPDAEWPLDGAAGDDSKVARVMRRLNLSPAGGGLLPLRRRPILSSEPRHPVAARTRRRLGTHSRRRVFPFRRPLLGAFLEDQLMLLAFRLFSASLGVAAVIKTSS